MTGQQLYQHWIGQNSSKEKAAFHIWMNENPSHKWEYLYMQHLWENGSFLPAEKVRELAIDDFAGIQSRIDTARKRTKLFRLIFCFSVFAILIGIGGFFMTQSKRAVYFDVRNESLSGTCQRLNQKYGMDIQVAESIQDCKINGTFLSNSPDSVLFRMARSFHLQCYQRRNTFFIDGKTCQN